MQTDYSKLIDRETWDFIRRIDTYYPPDAVTWPIERNRAVYGRMCREFHAGTPAGVSVSTTGIALSDRTVPIRIYRMENGDIGPTVLYFHGGGFILGGLDSHDDICAEICARTGLTLVSVDYRLAPEHIGTAAFDDALAAFVWTSETFGRRIVLVGESAGGTIAACLAANLPDDMPAPTGQVLIYPLLNGESDGPSYTTHAFAPLLCADDVTFYRRVRGANTENDPRFTPLACTSFATLPPTIVFTAQCDPIASDGDLYCERILAAGGNARLVKAAGLPHGFLRARTTSQRARRAFDRVTRSIAAISRRPIHEISSPRTVSASGNPDEEVQKW